jgi:hypothetical protein
MSIREWLRRMLELPSANHVVETHPWGETREWVDGDCRNVQWGTTVESWHELKPVVDQFLAAAVNAIAAAYPAEPVPWMVLSYDPLTGMLSVVPSREPSWPEAGARVELSLSSTFLESEAERTYNEFADGSYHPLYHMFWVFVVGSSLRAGDVSRRLAAARAVHPLRIAAFNSLTGCDDELVTHLDV